MAIDTAEKRRSAAGVPFLPVGPGVTPNASKDAEWRQQAGWSYSGIAAAVANLLGDVIVATVESLNPLRTVADLNGARTVSDLSPLRTTEKL